MKNILLIRDLTLLCIIITFTSTANSQDKWELVTRRDGIEVYTMSVDDSAYRSFKALTILNTSSEGIIKILKHFDGYANWFAYTKVAFPLESNGNIDFLYMETQMPWPFYNEDMVYKIDFIENQNSSIKVNLEGVPNYIPAKPGIKRMKSANGYILLNPTGAKTEIIYFMHSVPGGNMPVWLANNNIDELPYRTLHNLRGLLEH